MNNIYYFVKDENNLLKYQVLFDKDKLKKLRENVINNCSQIKHHEFEGTRYAYLLQNPEKYHNITYKSIGYQEYKDGPDEELYLIGYDEYEYPRLVDLIDNILKNVFNDDIFIQIFFPTLKSKSFAKKISTLSKNIDAIPNTNIEEKKAKLDELKELLNQAKLNEKQKNIYDYYLMLQNMISFKLIDSLTLEELNRMHNFFDIKRSNEQSNPILVKKIQDKQKR